MKQLTTISGYSMNTEQDLMNALRLMMKTKSVSDIAAKAGVGEQTMRNWLSGRNVPSLGLLIVVFQTIGRPIKFNF